MKLWTLIFFVSFLNIVYAQEENKYADYVKEAWSLYESGDYEQSADKYKQAFDQIEGKAYPRDRYNAACSYALTKDKENAFFHLFRLAQNEKTKYKNYNHIITDTDLNILHDDTRWNELLTIVKKNKEEAEKDLDKPLVEILDTINQLDQKYRMQIDEIEKKYGYESDEMKAHWQLIQKTDSINLIKVKKILDERGWLGPKIIGSIGNTTLFLVIQHSNHETQVKYLPMMREAVKLGNANANSLALLEDRVAIGSGEKQIYGSQIGRDQETGEHYVLPLIDPQNVDKRREEVGLGKLADYVSYWGLTWDVEKHKKRIEKLENKK